MKKIWLFLILPFLLVGCGEHTYTLKEISGIEVSNITYMQVSSSVYQSLAWNVDEKYYSYLDIEYILVDFDINKEFLSAWPPSEAKDDAICIHIAADNIHLCDMWYSAIFYISHKTHYMYTWSNEEGKSYRSKYVMPNSFIIEITTWN